MMHIPIIDRSKTPLCQLCRTAPAIQKSHVLSRFLWKQSRIAHRNDNKGFDFVRKDRPDLSKRNNKSGFSEPLLCLTCETTRSTLEKYMSDVLYQRQGIVRSNFVGHQVVEGLCYEKVKLFTMFNLFMMGVSQHPYYSSVNLGDHHTNLLRTMLLASDPGEPWMYGSIWIRLKFSDAPLEGISIAPNKFRWAETGPWTYRTVFAGICWMTFCSSHPAIGVAEPLFMGRSGPLVLFDAKISDLPFVSRRIDEWLIDNGHPPIYSRN